MTSELEQEARRLRDLIYGRPIGDEAWELVKQRWGARHQVAARERVRTDPMNSQPPQKDPQADLPLFQVADGDPNVAWLENYLKAVGEWMTAKSLVVIVGKGDTDDSRRWLRALAQESGWVISGQKGYKHLEHCTAEEVNHFVNWMQSQGKKMFERAERMRRNAHTIFG